MPDGSTLVQSGISDISSVVGENSVSIPDFGSSISELLDVKSFTQGQIDVIYKILQSELPENEQVNILLFISPQYTTHDLEVIKEIYKFFSEFGIHSGVIENLDGIDISSIDINFLNSEDFTVFNKDKNTFLNSVSLVLAGASISILDDYKKTEENRGNARNTGKTNISPITFKTFEKKIKILDTGASIRSVTKGGVNVRLTSGAVINIGAKCLTGKNVGIGQQNIAIKGLGCSRQEWINA